jgi:hypothetical protein
MVCETNLMLHFIGLLYDVTAIMYQFVVFGQSYLCSREIVWDEKNT